MIPVHATFDPRCCSVREVSSRVCLAAWPIVTVCCSPIQGSCMMLATWRLKRIKLGIASKVCALSSGLCFKHNTTWQIPSSCSPFHLACQRGVQGVPIIRALLFIADCCNLSATAKVAVDLQPFFLFVFNYVRWICRWWRGNDWELSLFCITPDISYTWFTLLARWTTSWSFDLLPDISTERAGYACDRVVPAITTPVFVIGIIVQ